MTHLYILICTAHNNRRALQHRGVHVVGEHRYYGIGDVQLLSECGTEFAEPLRANSGSDGVANVEEVRRNERLVAYDRT